MHTVRVYNGDSFKYALENLRSSDLIDYMCFQFSPKFCEIHGIKSYVDLQASMSHYVGYDLILNLPSIIGFDPISTYKVTGYRSYAIKTQLSQIIQELTILHKNWIIVKKKENNG